MPLPTKEYKPYLYFVIYIILLLSLYYNVFSWLIFQDWQRGDFSYCSLIPLIVIYLIWEKRNDLKNTPSIPSWKGIILVLAGLVLFWVGELAGEFFSQYFSFWLIVVGLCWLHLGTEKIKKIWFPLVFLLAMFPIPQFITNRLTLKLKLISSQLGVWLMQTWGMAVYREGNIIDLGFTKLQVLNACSGLRYFFPLLIVGILLAYYYKNASWWKRTVVVLIAIPLSIITNSFRIALTGILYEKFGAEVAEGFFHSFSGYCIFMISCAFLLFVMWLLNKIFPTKSIQKPTVKSSFVDNKISEQTKTVRLKERVLPIVAIFFLAISVFISWKVNFREKIPIARPFSEFPLKIGKWTGVRKFMSQSLIKTLDLSDYIVVDYKDPEGHAINFYVAYYESQSKGKSIHSPSTCLPGSGWIFNEAKKIVLVFPNYHKKLPVKRIIMQKGSQKFICYYWFPLRDRIATNAYEIKFYNFLDALIKHRTDGALVRIITPIYETETIRHAELRIRNFVQAVLPILDSFLPK